MSKKYDYLGPCIHGICEYRIGGEVGYVTPSGVVVNKNKVMIKKNN